MLAQIFGTFHGYTIYSLEVIMGGPNRPPPPPPPPYFLTSKKLVLIRVKGRNFRGQKLSRGKKIAKFLELTFANGNFYYKFRRKNFRESKIICIFVGKNFREWQKYEKKTLRIRLLTRKNNLFFNNILSYTIYFYISSPSRPFSLLCMPWRIKKAILEIFLGRKKLSQIEFFLEFHGKKLSRFTDLKFPKELTLAKKAKNRESFCPRKFLPLRG